MTVCIKNISDLKTDLHHKIEMDVNDVRSLHRKDFICVLDGKTRVIICKLNYFCTTGNKEVLDYVELVVKDI